MRIASEPEKAGKGSSVSSNDTKRTSGTEKLAVSPYAETVAVSLTWSHVAPASTCSPPAPYEAQLASRGSIVTFVRVSKVKSLLVPSSKNTVIVTVALVGREIGLAAALSSGSVSLYLPMLSANDWALGTCTCTGARPLARVTAGQASHAVLTIWPHSVTALLATSTSHRESDRCTCKLAEVDVTLSSSGGTNHVWPSLKSTDASTVPRSPSARKRCRSCTRAAKLALTAHATVAGGVRDQNISVTTADCSATTVTAASTTATDAGVTEIEALEIVTEASPGDEAYTTLPDRVTLPDASRVTRSVTSMSETLASPAPPKTATAVASVCWYSGDAHASDPSMRLSVPSATCTDSCCGNHTVRGTEVLAPPCSDFTSTDAVPPCIMLLVSSTVHGEASPNRPAGTDTALQEKSDDEVVVAMGCDGRSVNCTTVISTATSTPLSTAVLAGSAVAGYASTASTLAACSTCSWPLDCAPPRRPLIWPGWVSTYGKWPVLTIASTLKLSTPSNVPAARASSTLNSKVATSRSTLPWTSLSATPGARPTVRATSSPATWSFTVTSLYNEEKLDDCSPSTAVPYDSVSCHAASAYAAAPVFARTSTVKRSPAYKGPVGIVATMPTSSSNGCVTVSICSPTKRVSLLATSTPS
mmetsp:Transcript_60695/g.146064  ORF Transcript_60695/g.146064 Transcript_60695/m.146064 type:complete len:644 (-) Transcript_60695:284-2215(-)